jgi:hypothetical protein
VSKACIRTGKGDRKPFPFQALFLKFEALILHSIIVGYEGVNIRQCIPNLILRVHREIQRYPVMGWSQQGTVPSLTHHADLNGPTPRSQELPYVQEEKVFQELRVKMCVSVLDVQKKFPEGKLKTGN